MSGATDNPQLRPGVLALLAALLWLAAGCAAESPEDSEVLPGTPTQRTFDYHTTQTRVGIPLWELWGETASRYPGDKRLQLTEVKMVFYENGQQHATLTSRSGEIDETTRDMTAIGEVEVVSVEGRVLTSEVLHWANEREKIHTDRPFRLVDDDQILTGVGMETDPDLTDLEIFADATFDLPAQEGSSDREDRP